MMMKKLFLAALLLLGLGLSSCGQKDTPIMYQGATTGDRITLSVDFASEAESAPRAMTVSSGGSDLVSSIEYYYDPYANADYKYVKYRFGKKVVAKAVFSRESTEPVTLVFYYGGKVYPVESQMTLQNVNGHYRGDIGVTLPAALSGVPRSRIEVAGVLGATSVDATTGKVTVTAPPAVVEGEEMQTLPMYFPKTALSASSNRLSGLRFKFLGVLFAIPIVVDTTEPSSRTEKVKASVFSPEVISLGTERFTESQVEVDLSAGGEPTMTRTASSTHVHPLRKTEVRFGDVPKVHLLYVFPVHFGRNTAISPKLSGTYYAKANKTEVKNFVINLDGNLYFKGFGIGAFVFWHDMTIAYFNRDRIGTYRYDRPDGLYSSFSGRDI
jgi:lipoprotein